MGVYLVTAELEHTSGLPADSAVNTFHFEMAEIGGSPENSNNVLDMIEDFYTAIPAGDTGEISDLLSPDLTGVINLTGYRLADAQPRVPRFERTFTATINALAALPEEVALCVSYKAAPLAGAVPARRRGRIYIGPLARTSDTLDPDGGPASVARTRLQRAGRDFVAASLASISNKWIVFSRVNNSGAVIVEGFVDNAWDTQRRRGPDATSRLLFSQTTP